nr:hypothetical protein GCM10020241_62250 [Streptoalloteichus tenebrarius]
MSDAPPARGRLTCDVEIRSAVAKDFGHVVRRMPDAALRPESAEDVAALVTFAAQRGLPVAARGRGHSTAGQAQVEGGVVIDMSTLDAIRDVGPGFVDVDAGASWRSVVEATLPHGLTPPVLTDYLGLSVGGTLSVGGIGGAAHQHGMQTDNVLELDVVTGDGALRTCSASRESSLFHAVLGGLGQCGVITRARLRLVPAPDRARCYKLFHPTVRSLTRDQRRLLADGRFPYLEGQVKAGEGGWRPMLEAVAFLSEDDLPRDSDLVGDLAHDQATLEIEDVAYLDFLDRMAPGEEYLRSTGEWFHPHPWWNAFLPDSTVDDVVEEVLSGLSVEDLGPSGVILLYPTSRRRMSTPLVRMPDEPVVFLFAILRTAPLDDPTALVAMLRSNRALYERVRAAGGTRYPVASVPFDRDDWARHFGAAWPGFVAAKDRYDPHRVLAPGQGIF